ncbi:MAG: hypothetical protein FJ257_12680 [Phycisphaerae bacterium]|nr:hypothetical protein [Phycisphaerae bacterium]
MSSIWDPPDTPEEIAREELKARLAREARHAEKVAEMKARYEKAALCSLLGPEDAPPAPTRSAPSVTPTVTAETPPPASRSTPHGEPPPSVG